MASVDSLPPGLWPVRAPIQGYYARVEPLNASVHSAELYTALHADDPDGALWTYLPYGPFSSLESFHSWMRSNSAVADPVFFAIRDLAIGKASGVASLMTIEPLHGTIEIGHIALGPAMQKTREATEGLYLLMRHAMDDLGNRRLEWKCDAANTASRRAAQRFGFMYEGTFAQHRIVKGRNRDTAWYSILNSEWPSIRSGFEQWLAPANFDDLGRQRTSMREITNAIRGIG
jgi:RimJ/RimL family protein N-acetyltransferase